MLQKIGTMAYKLDFSASSRIRLVLHVSCLNNVICDKLQVQTIFPEIGKEGKIIVKPKAITKIRI